MTSDEFLDLKELPASVVVIGGGVVGCEFASLLADLGSKVTILEALDSILPGCDDDIVRLVVRSFKKRGIDIVTGAKVEGHTPSADGTDDDRQGGGRRRSTWRPSWCRWAGAPAPKGLVADGVGVQIDERGFVWTDEYQRTGVDGVWAVGDIVAGTPQLAHVGFAEAIVAVKGMLGEPVVPVDNGKVPWAIYCHPEVAFCGMTEAQAKAAGIDGRDQEGPLRRQQPGADHRRHRGRGEDRRREAARRHGRQDPRRAHVRALGDRAAQWRATSPSTGRPSPRRWPSSSSRTRRCPRHSARPCSR